MHKVMIVDDEAVVITQLEERLTLMGYDIVGSASSGTEAVEMARHLRPDMVLMDIVMPGRLDGIDASQKIKTELDIPAIFVTAYTDDKFVERAKKVEPFGYIVKPFQEREIKASIDVALHKKDIERKLRESEEKLRESEERFRAISETAQDSIFIKDRMLKYSQVNPAMERLFGLPASEIIGYTDKNLFGKEAAAHIMELDSRVLNGEIIEEEYAKPVRGIPITFHVIKTPMYNSSGEIIGLCGIARDITERRLAEEALSKSKETLLKIVAGTSVPVFVIDEKHTVTHWNRACENITGIPANEVIGTSKQWKTFYSKERPVMADLIMDEAAEEEISRYYGNKYQKSVIMEGAYEAADFFPDIGENGRWLFFTAAPLRDCHEKVIGAIETLQDITDRKQAEEELKKHREHLRFINRILRHDIINDLAVVKSGVRLYRDSRDEGLLDEITKRVDKGVELIREMKELESFVSSHKDLEFCNVKSAIKKVIGNYGSIRFTIEGRGRVLADEALGSVIDNIVRNAIDHGKTDRIDIKIEKSGRYCEVRIADYGIGIPDEIKGKIFDESFTYGETGHTGLGLHIVRKAMENYGGSVHVEDNIPQGTVFVLRLRRIR